MATGPEEEAYREALRVGSIWKYLRLQDASQKRRMAGQDRGMWRETKTYIIDGYIYQLVGEGK